MNKILVPSDFSTNSKSGIRFAIQWDSQQNLELVFIHVLNILMPTGWPQARIDKYIAAELQSCRHRLKNFIDEIYRSIHVKPGLYSTVVIKEYQPAKAILEYCRKDKTIDYICISTNGAAALKKFFGTTTSELIAKLSIPVVAIPKNYRLRAVKSVLYASDFYNYKNELSKVLSFATIFKAKVDVIHFAWPGELPFDAATLQKFSGEYQYGLTVCVENSDPSLSLTQRLQKAILKRKPSVVIMFSNKERNLLQRIFGSSKAKELSFSLKAPLMVYSKTKSPVRRMQ